MSMRFLDVPGYRDYMRNVAEGDYEAAKNDLYSCIEHVRKEDAPLYLKTKNEPVNRNSSQTDRVKAWSPGGGTTDENSANSCARCNPSKGAKELGTEWVPPRNR